MLLASFQVPSRRRLSRQVLVVGAMLSVGLAWTVPARAQDTDKTTVAVPAGATVESLFTDFLHYARMGRFSTADAYAKALLAHPELDPVKVMKIANRDKDSLNTLLIIIANSSIGESATRVLDLIQQGEHVGRKQSDRIRENIALLGGNPQQEFFAQQRLIESGEYAVPLMIETLLDKEQQALWPRVIVSLTKLGKGAVRPLVMALRMRNNDVRIHVIRALGEIGYPQAVPYLSRLIVNKDMPGESKQAAGAAISRIEAISGRTISGGAKDQFLGLAEWFYHEDPAVRADPRLREANIWYWDHAEQMLHAVVVSRPIFGQVMAMRCCEEVLHLENDHAPAIALWLAANIRREGRLGMDVESGDPGEVGDPDPTRPSAFPRALYFSQAAGPRYAHMVLARAIKESDTAVALGAIEALRITAGRSSLVGSEDIKQPLVQALRFPDLLVRIRAALALGAALPTAPFADAEFVTPMLAQAVTLSGRSQMIVLDTDQQNRNRVAEILRSSGRAVIADSSYYPAMERARVETQSIAAMLVSTDVGEPGVARVIDQFRAEFQYAKTPVVLLTKPTHDLMAEDLADRFPYVTMVSSDADDTAIEHALMRLQSKTGRATIDDALALSLAKQSVDTLRRLAEDGRTVFDVSVAQPALLAALEATDESLQISAASVLALLSFSSAQHGIAAVALDDGRSTSLRVAAFRSLAESAKGHGNMLEPSQIDALVETAAKDGDLVIRTAASEALGAMNLSNNQASEILRSYYGG